MRISKNVNYSCWVHKHCHCHHSNDQEWSLKLTRIVHSSSFGSRFGTVGLGHYNHIVVNHMICFAECSDFLKLAFVECSAFLKLAFIMYTPNWFHTSLWFIPTTIVSASFYELGTDHITENLFFWHSHNKSMGITFLELLLLVLYFQPLNADSDMQHMA